MNGIGRCTKVAPNVLGQCDAVDDMASLPAARPSLQPEMPTLVDLERRGAPDHRQTQSTSDPAGGNVRVKQERVNQIRLKSAKKDVQPTQDAPIASAATVAREGCDSGVMQDFTHRPRRAKAADGHVDAEVAESQRETRTAHRRSPALVIGNQQDDAQWTVDGRCHAGVDSGSVGSETTSVGSEGAVDGTVLVRASTRVRSTALIS